MARKTIKYTVPAGKGRDAGKVFVLTEMPASQAEKWAMRALLGVARSGVDVPPDLMDMGMAGLAVLGVRSLGKMNWDDAEPLIDEMFGCVKAMPDPSRPEVTRDLVESDTEEVLTRLELRKQILGLHMDFFTVAAP